MEFEKLQSIIAEVLNIDADEVTMDKKKMHLNEPIKSIGTYMVPIRLHPQVTAELKVIVKGK